MLMAGILVPVAAVGPGLMRHEEVIELETAEDDVKKTAMHEDHYHALLLAVPIVMQNLTYYSGMVATDNSLHLSNVSHKFGDFESDKRLLLENVDGLVSLMQEISDESRQSCPMGRVETVNTCLRKALCMIQSQVDAVGSTEDAHKYAMYEEVHNGIHDIAWPMITSKLSQEGNHKVGDGYLSPAQHSCSGNEMSSSLMESASDNAVISAAKAAAYRTSMALVDGAKATHAVLDSHTHNSSVDATLVALREAWEPSCQMLKCDPTNFLDVYRASYAHSGTLLQLGVPASHMQVHIRTRGRFERRMQSFLGEHGEHFGHRLLRDEDADHRFKIAAKQYAARARGSLLQFATGYANKRKVNTREYPMKLVDSEKMAAFFEARGKSHVLQSLRGEDGEEDGEDSMALVEDGEEEQHEDVDVVRRWGKGGKGAKKALGDKLKKIKKSLKSKYVDGPLGDIVDAANSVASTGKGLIDDAEKLAEEAADHGEAFGKGVTKFAKGLGDKFVGMGHAVADHFEDVGESIGDFATGAANGIQDLGNDIAYVADTVGTLVTKFAEDFAEWIESLFACLGQFHEVIAQGYGKTWQNVYPPGTGVAISIGGSYSTGITAGIMSALLSGNAPGSVTVETEAHALKIALSIVVGATPGDVKVGGLRAGPGIAGGVRCPYGKGCTIGIAVGSTGSALVPNPNFNFCPAGKFIITPIGEMYCFFSYTVVVTVICCTFNMGNGEQDCR